MKTVVVASVTFFVLCTGGVLYMATHHPSLFKEEVMWLGGAAIVGCFVCVAWQALKKDLP